MKYIVIQILKGYKKFISPVLVPIFGNACRFTPTCSEYTMQSVEKFGIIKGLWMGMKRISRCHPFSDASD